VKCGHPAGCHHREKFAAIRGIRFDYGSFRELRGLEELPVPIERRRKPIGARKEK
jgi:hypothetical protein